ncbi:MAG: WG repeat-containing protein [candidate division WOR-3 bacterium]
MKNFQKTSFFKSLSKMLFFMFLLSNAVLLFAKNLPEPPELIPYRKGDKWGFCDRNKKIVIECKYDYVEPFNNGFAIVKINDELFFINTKGEESEPPSTEEQQQEVQSEELLEVFEENGFYGYSDKAGNVLITPQYQQADGFSNGLASVKKNNRWGYIDTKGNLIIPFKYDDAWMFDNGLALVGIDGYLGYIDAKGNEYWEDFKSYKNDNKSWLKDGTKLNYTIDYIDLMSFELKEVSDKIHYSWYRMGKKGGEIIISSKALKNSLNQFNYIYSSRNSNDPLVLTDGTSVFCSQNMFKELKKKKKVTYYPYSNYPSTEINQTPVELFLKGQKKVKVKYKDKVIVLDCILCEAPTGERLVVLNNPQYPLIVHMILNFKTHLKSID